MRVSVIGGRTITDRERAVAEDVGRELGARSHGGLWRSRQDDGCRLPGCQGGGRNHDQDPPWRPPRAANEYVDVPIATGSATPETRSSR